MLVIKRHNREGCVIFTSDGNVRVSPNIKELDRNVMVRLCFEAPRSIRVLRDEVLPRGSFREMPPTPTPAELALKDIIDRAADFMKRQGHADAAAIIEESTREVFHKYRIG